MKANQLGNHISESKSNKVNVSENIGNSSNSSNPTPLEELLELKTPGVQIVRQPSCLENYDPDTLL